ncbi:hypothetical protein CC80DRAFT_529725 [Byssothecium circinans]|uniref:ABC transporter domain-containing protein n=1 Tax=Byssothecium circinans TaxID=147558 RepID=A0A6A5TDY1_9PLEO|nr:hypothetical protein CC80DRAFT_529725 [Byssothecium circinans]
MASIDLSDLDPGRDEFEVIEWLRSFRNLTADRGELGLRSSGAYFFKDLDVQGTLSSEGNVETFASAALVPLKALGRIFKKGTANHVKILYDVEGVLDEGEMLAVLGRSGSGCSTLLKVLAKDRRDLVVGRNAEIIHKDAHDCRCAHTAETDTHFPELTVWETVRFAAEARLSQASNLNREVLIKHVTGAILRTFNLMPARDTNIGNDLIRGVSGGEKRRVTIAETFASFAPTQFWDNSTRGMDSSTALDCIHTFQAFSRITGATSTVSLYQASQSILDCFDKVTVLYDGRQIFFGTWSEAEEYFESIGFRRPDTYTTGDFLTALTNPVEARALKRLDWDQDVPETAEDFSKLWKGSTWRKLLSDTIEIIATPYQLPFSMQMSLCLQRDLRRVRNNLGVPISFVFGNAIIAIIIGTVFWKLEDTAEAIPRRAVLIFFSVLVNSFMTGFEVLGIWFQKPIVEKHRQLLFYSPVAEAVASMICDMPAKLASSLSFNVTFYFMTNLRRSATAFLTFWIFSFICMMTMSMFFRCLGSMGRTHDQTMVPIGITIMLCIIYTGFVIPVPYMQPWLSWFRWLNPVAYAFESLIINEFRRRHFPCVKFLPSGPSYDDIPNANRSCLNVAASSGSDTINGERYIEAIYTYNTSHLWRNLGIIACFLVFFCAAHLLTSRTVAMPTPASQVLRKLKARKGDPQSQDQELGLTNPPIKNSAVSASIPRSIKNMPAIWAGLSYDIKTKNGMKRLLDDVDGYVESGTLTALIGSTGAGKTTLLDVVAGRKTIGVLTADAIDSGVGIATAGYVQQADYHVPTSTVREAIRFSTDMRLSMASEMENKLQYVEDVMAMLGLEAIADAIVDSLSIEQRRRLTIAVELASKPEVLFLDEPTSGLDSQTAFTICSLLRDLASKGHAILCTIHQPSASTFSMFDRLLLIERGGRTIYFGDTGPESKSVITYFQSRGALPYAKGQNPAEWLLAATSTSFQPPNTPNWHAIWKSSTERRDLKRELENAWRSKARARAADVHPPSTSRISFAGQMRVLLQRTMIEYWRTPSPLCAKFFFYAGAALMIGLSTFQSPATIQGLQNQLFAIFLLFTTFSNVMQKIIPQFAARRSLFEAREQPSKTFSWQAFLASTILVEALWQIIFAMVSFILLYYLTGFHLQSTDRNERGGLFLLLVIAFFLLTSTLSHLLIVGIQVDETAVNIGQLVFYLTLIFCGAIVTKTELTKFWTFMYWVSPLTYILRAMIAVGIGEQVVNCSSAEIISIPSRPGTSCGDYLNRFIAIAGGRAENPLSSETCMYCPLRNTHDFLTVFSMSYQARWRDLGIALLYVSFNAGAAFGVYWLCRVWKRRPIEADG